jgi:hypothetical protein
MRGNRPSNNRRGPNPLTRSYESNGPDVKIRGNAHHIAEKYLQLARDAHTGGDPVAAENYLQHAEHYFRLIASAQAAQAQAQSGKPPGEGEGGEFEDDDDFGGVADRFASPAERAPAPYAPQPAQGYAPPPAGAGPQPYAEGGERPPQQQQPQGDRNNGYQQGQGRQQDRQQQRPQQDRGPRQDRNDRNFNDRQGRDFRPREFRPYRDANPPRDVPPAPVGDAATALPSFITAAPRVTTAPESEAPAPMENGVEAGGQIDSGSSASEQSGDPRFPGRGRRRRLRSPYGFHPSGNQDEEGEGPLAPDDAPVSE